jgi:hypothetical protein
MKLPLRALSHCTHSFSYVWGLCPFAVQAWKEGAECGIKPGHAEYRSKKWESHNKAALEKPEQERRALVYVVESPDPSSYETNVVDILRSMSRCPKLVSSKAEVDTMLQYAITRTQTRAGEVNGVRQSTSGARTIKVSHLRSLYIVGGSKALVEGMPFHKVRNYEVAWPLHITIPLNGEGVDLVAAGMIGWLQGIWGPGMFTATPPKEGSIAAKNPDLCRKAAFATAVRRAVLENLSSLIQPPMTTPGGMHATSTSVLPGRSVLVPEGRRKFQFQEAVPIAKSTKSGCVRSNGTSSGRPQAVEAMTRQAVSGGSSGEASSAIDSSGAASSSTASKQPRVAPQASVGVSDALGALSKRPLRPQKRKSYSESSIPGRPQFHSFSQNLIDSDGSSDEASSAIDSSGAASSSTASTQPKSLWPLNYPSDAWRVQIQYEDFLDIQNCDAINDQVVQLMLSEIAQQTWSSMPTSSSLSLIIDSPIISELIVNHFGKEMSRSKAADLLNSAACRAINPRTSKYLQGRQTPCNVRYVGCSLHSASSRHYTVLIFCLPDCQEAQQCFGESGTIYYADPIGSPFPTKAGLAFSQWLQVCFDVTLTPHQLCSPLART